MKNDQAERLGTAAIGPLLWRFSLPAIVGMLVQALYNVVDRIFVGRGVGELGLAGVTVCFPFMMLIMAFSMLVGVGGNSLISMRLGEGRKAEAEKVLGNAMLLMVLISLIVTVVGLALLKPLLRFFGASATVLPYAEAYMRIILWGTLFSVIGHGMNNFIRGEGNPGRAMLTMLSGAGLNVILAPLFIFKFGWGIQGAAIATIISQALAAVLVLGYFFSGHSLVKVRFKNFLLDRAVINPILAIGAAPCALQLGSSLLNTILNHQLYRYGGDQAVSVMGIIFAVIMLLVMPVFGICQGAQPIIGYNYGARNFTRVRHTLLLAIVCATFIEIVGYLVIMLAPEAIITLFTRHNAALLAAGRHGLRLFLCMLPVVGFQVVSSQYFMAVGKARHSMLLGLSRQFLLLIPLLIVLPPFFGIDGCWYAGPLSDLGSSLITGWFLSRELRQLQVRVA